jgi:hypothetical protein
MNFSRRCFTLMVVAFACVLMTNSASAQNKITWITDAQTAFPASDIGWSTLLQSKGYVVTRDTITKGTLTAPLTQAQIDALNSADLIIISRSATSGNYTDTTGWNLNVTKPILCMATSIVRSSDRLKWFTGTNVDNGLSPVTKITNKTHPIFTGVTVPADSSVQMLDSTIGAKSTSLLKLWVGSNAGNAQVLAMAKDTSNRCVAIAYWDAGTAFYTGSSNKAGGKRMWFNAGTYNNGSNPPAVAGGLMNLTPAGKQIFFNAVQYMITGKVTAVENQPTPVPSAFALGQNYPNPFNPSTTISFAMSAPEFVSITVFDMLGRAVATLVNDVRPAGNHTVTFDASRLSSGMYVYRMQTGAFTTMKKMTLVK